MRTGMRYSLWTLLMKQAYDCFIMIFTTIYKNNFKYKTHRAPKGSRKPWVTVEILKKINERNRLFKQFVRTKNQEILHLFKKCRNEVTNLIRRAKSTYYFNMFNNLSTSASIWKKLNSILGKTSASSRNKTLKINGQELGGVELANKFNDYFINLDSNDRSRVNEALVYVSRFINESIFFYPTDVHEVSSVFCNLNNSKNCDIDGIQIKPVKYVIEQIAPILTHLFNLSLSQGIFPKKMQIAKVSILYKSGDKNDLSNYRPVSVLPIFSKGLDKLIHFRSNQFCEKFSIVTESQFGFRKGRSTELALLNMKEIILKNIENKILTVGIFIDFSKAFDRLNHDTLMSKL